MPPLQIPCGYAFVRKGNKRTRLVMTRLKQRFFLILAYSSILFPQFF